MVELNAYTIWATGAGGLTWDWVLVLTAGLALDMSALLWYGVIYNELTGCRGIWHPFILWTTICGYFGERNMYYFY